MLKIGKKFITPIKKTQKQSPTPLTQSKSPNAHSLKTEAQLTQNDDL